MNILSFQLYDHVRHEQLSILSNSLITSSFFVETQAFTIKFEL